MAARILIVDDDAHIRDSLVKLLTPEGYELETAVNGIEALQRVATRQPDMMLLDVSMSPGPDGFEVCRQIKSDQRTALIPITFLTAQSELEHRRLGIEVGADDYLTKPVSSDSLCVHVRSQLRLKKLTDELESPESMLFMLARTIEAKDSYTTGHLRRMEHYSSQLASAAGISGEDLTSIRYAAILHDIGKIRISEHILTRRGLLTPEEFAEFKSHPAHGAQMISHMRLAHKIAPIILSHHEHWDGKGYPYGLRSTDIPIGGRIVSIVDAYDAMTTDRPYRRAMSQKEAVRRLFMRAGSQWDPSLISLFLKLIEHNQLAANMLDDSSLNGQEEYIP
jgi:putative two-component system response regulator